MTTEAGNDENLFDKARSEIIGNLSGLKDIISRVEDELPIKSEFNHFNDLYSAFKELVLIIFSQGTVNGFSVMMPEEVLRLLGRFSEVYKTLLRSPNPEALNPETLMLASTLTSSRAYLASALPDDLRKSLWDIVIPFEPTWIDDV